LHQLVNHEDVKAESRRKSGHHAHHNRNRQSGVITSVESVDGKDGKSDVSDTSVKDETSELIPSLAAREEDTAEESKPITSPGKLVIINVFSVCKLNKR